MITDDYKQAVGKRATALENSDLSGVDLTPVSSRKRTKRPPEYFHDGDYEAPLTVTRKTPKLALQTPSFQLVLPDPEPISLNVGMCTLS